MSDELDQDRDLDARLEEAARWCEPRDPGWSTLLERLGRRRRYPRPLSVRTEGSALTPGPSPETGEGVAAPPASPLGEGRRARLRRLVSLAAGLLVVVTLAAVVAIMVRHGSSPRSVGRQSARRGPTPRHRGDRLQRRRERGADALYAAGRLAERCKPCVRPGSRTAAVRSPGGTAANVAKPAGWQFRAWAWRRLSLWLGEPTGRPCWAWAWSRTSAWSCT